MNHSTQGYPSRLKLSCSVGGRSSGSSRRRSGRRRHPNMTQAPRCHSDASSTGSSASVRLFAHLKTSPCSLSDQTPIHESNLRRVQTFPNRAQRRQPELTFAYIVFCDPNRFSFATEWFIPKSFIPRAGKPRDQSHDIDCIPKLDTTDL